MKKHRLVFFSLFWAFSLAHAAHRNQRDPEFFEAILQGNCTKVQEMLKKGTPNRCNLMGRSALTTASKLGFEDIVEALLRGGADPDGAGEDGEETPLMKAAVLGHVNIVRILLRYGANPLRTIPDYLERRPHLIDILGRIEQHIPIRQLAPRQTALQLVIHALTRAPEEQRNRLEEIRDFLGFRSVTLMSYSSSTQAFPD